jgi:hypothetical protein
MKKIQIGTAALAFIVLTISLAPDSASAQEAPDNAMFLVEYLKVLPGHQDDFAQALRQHNIQYHSDGGRQNFVYYIVNGQRTGEFVIASGPMTLKDMDEPAGEGHGQDWFNRVLAHAVAHDRNFWVQQPEQSYVLDNNAEPHPITRVRYFEVTDNAKFARGQAQMTALAKKDGGDIDRVMYRQRFPDMDDVDWVIVRNYKSWAEIDEPNPGSGTYAERFEAVHGKKSFEKLQADMAGVITGREDEFWALNTWLSGMQEGQ